MVSKNTSLAGLKIPTNLHSYKDNLESLNLFLASKKQLFFIQAVRNIRPRGYKTFFMLNSTEHGISTVHKN